ncbi:chaperone protein dnaJ 49-like [Rhododendron vialii]|uniref:chaperone protein dnaJ 49-like n=1 Tax=Rhododendron vialii TaxID=182163 RepID=UPI00266002F5|nr:chaperone protein dnaJ 49-like [Rhododendron vialii]XP_058187604.1 chaperone protein dnaJ 49-like [Rhododendron vialii]
MDGNKDEALKCMNIARSAIGSGDRTRAQKFITKAQRLDPSLSLSASDLLSNLDAQPGPTTKSPPPPPSARPRVRVSASGSKPESSDSATSVAYTEEQISIVREIKRKKNYYEILGVEESCGVEEIRKAYRKLSLKVHPDKNKAPGAEEAFKAVSKAFQCLSNEESRKRYKLVGSDEEVFERRAAAPRRGGGQGFFDGDVDAEEIFRNFFYGGMNPAGRNTQFGSFSFGPGMGVRMGNNNRNNNNNGNNGSVGLAKALIQLLPVLLILVFSFMPSNDPVYSISRQYPYQYRFTTQKGVNYYVKSGGFVQRYPPNSPERVRLEEQVERDYVSILAHNCRLELQRFQWGYIRETPHCDSLKQFEAVAG